MFDRERAFFFDLDGTLVDSARGIGASFNVALKKLGLNELPPDDLRSCIGPPIREVFKRLLGVDEHAVIENAVDEYRAAYRSGLMFDNTVYPGIEALLASLKESGRRLFILTAKAQPYAGEIVKHHGLLDYFEAVYGPELGGHMSSKSELFAHALTENRLDGAVSAVIGDRANDVNAARANKARSLGVLWGYGSEPELKEAGADFIVHTVPGAAELLLPELPFRE